MMGKILILVSLVVVALILFAGIGVMAIGGETGAKWSNVLMRYRVIAQAVAVAILMVVLYFSSPALGTVANQLNPLSSS